MWRLFSNPKMIFALFVLLVGFNAVLLFMLLHRPGPPRPGEGLPGREGEPPHSAARDYLIRELALDASQQKKFSDRYFTHQQLVRPLLAAQRAARDSLFDLLASPQQDSVAAQRFENRIGQTQTQIETATFNHFSQLRQLCNSEQQSRFDAVIREALRMMAEPGGNPRRK